MNSEASGCNWNYLLLWLAILSILGKPTHSAFCGEPSDSFEQAGNYAQARVVKIYGAKVGSTPGYASGLVVSEDGLILTANGTYLNGDRVRVVLPDGSSHVATIVRRNRELQLAMLKIKAKTPMHFDLSKTRKTFRGEWVLGVSNVFKIADGNDPASMMLGIVSLQTKLEAKRGNEPFPFEGDVLLLDMISSNPGAPGGAVVDGQSGQLIGMIGPILESRSSGTRLNYAIPVTLLALFIVGDEIPVAASPPSKPMQVDLGIQVFRLGGKDSPAYVDRIDAESSVSVPLKTDDVILSIGNERIRTVRQYDEVVAKLVVGEPVELTVKRGSELIPVTIKPMVRKDEQR